MKLYIEKIRRMDFAELLPGCWWASEGDRKTFSRDRRRAASISRELGAVPLGTGPGRAFQQAAELPYLRDFMLDRGVMADVSETSTVWSKLLPLYESSRHAIQEAIE